MFVNVQLNFCEEKSFNFTLTHCIEVIKKNCCKIKSILGLKTGKKKQNMRVNKVRLRIISVCNNFLFHK